MDHARQLAGSIVTHHFECASAFAQACELMTGVSWDSSSYALPVDGNAEWKQFLTLPQEHQQICLSSQIKFLNDTLDGTPSVLSV